jgi:hypothetical protein
MRYQKKFGDGITVKPNKTRLKIDYRAASPSIRGDMKIKVPDLPNPFVKERARKLGRIY